MFLLFNLVSEFVVNFISSQSTILLDSGLCLYLLVCSICVGNNEVFGEFESSEYDFEVEVLFNTISFISDSCLGSMSLEGTSVSIFVLLSVIEGYTTIISNFSTMLFGIGFEYGSVCIDSLSCVDLSLFVLESISLITRPISMGLRLFSNLTVSSMLFGLLLISVQDYFISSISCVSFIGSIVITSITCFIVVGFTFVEIFISFVQVFVYSTMSDMNVTITLSSCLLLSCNVSGFGEYFDTTSSEQITNFLPLSYQSINDFVIETLGRSYIYSFMFFFLLFIPYGMLFVMVFIFPNRFCNNFTGTSLLGVFGFNMTILFSFLMTSLGGGLDFLSSRGEFLMDSYYMYSFTFYCCSTLGVMFGQMFGSYLVFNYVGISRGMNFYRSSSVLDMTVGSFTSLGMSCFGRLVFYFIVIFVQTIRRRMDNIVECQGPVVVRDGQPVQEIILEREQSLRECFNCTIGQVDVIYYIIYVNLRLIFSDMFFTNRCIIGSGLIIEQYTEDFVRETNFSNFFITGLIFGDQFNSFLLQPVNYGYTENIESSFFSILYRCFLSLIFTILGSPGFCIILYVLERRQREQQRQRQMRLRYGVQRELDLFERRREQLRQQRQEDQLRRESQQRRQREQQQNDEQRRQ